MLTQPEGAASSGEVSMTQPEGAASSGEVDEADDREKNKDEILLLGCDVEEDARAMNLGRKQIREGSVSCYNSAPSAAAGSGAYSAENELIPSRATSCSSPEELVLPPTVVELVDEFAGRRSYFISDASELLAALTSGNPPPEPEPRYADPDVSIYDHPAASSSSSTHQYLHEQSALAGLSQVQENAPPRPKGKGPLRNLFRADPRILGSESLRCPFWPRREQSSEMEAETRQKEKLHKRQHLHKNTLSHSYRYSSFRSGCIFCYISCFPP
eukprot:g19010.t1